MTGFFRFGLIVAAAVAAPAAAQEACLFTLRPQVTQRAPEGCRLQGAVLNACGRLVPFALVRAVPHPQRGPLPTQAGSVERFAVQPITLERELCEQDVRVIELTAGSSLDATQRPMTPAPAPGEVEMFASRINACVAQCPAPVLDRAAIVAELRPTYRHAVDDREAGPALDAVVAAVAAERAARDQICARVCHGSLPQAEAPAQLAATTEARQQSMAAPAATLAAIAARSPRAAPAPDIPALDDSERRPPGAAVAAQGGRLVRDGAQPVRSCRPTRRGQRCTMVLDTRQLGQAVGRSRREARSSRGRSEARQSSRRSEARSSSRRGQARSERSSRRRR